MDKKVFGVFGILVLFCSGSVYASHLQDVNADNISIGTLDPNRVNDDTFTLRGSAWSQNVDSSTGTLSSRLNAVAVDTTSLRDSFNASTTTITNTVRSQKVYSVVIGSASSLATQSDVQSDNTSGLSSALVLLAAMGLTNSTTGFGTIFYRTGTYAILNATIPAGVVITAAPGSSVTFVSSDIDQTMLTIYGKVDGINFDFQNAAHAAPKIVMKSNSSCTNFKTINGQSFADSGKLTSQFALLRSTGVYLQGTLENPRGLNSSGGRAAIMCVFSSRSVITVNITSGSIAQSASAMLVFEGCKDVILRDSRIMNASGSPILFEATNRNVVIDRLYMSIDGVCAGAGCIAFQPADDGNTFATGDSSGNVIMNSTIINDNDQNTSVIKFNQTTGASHNTYIMGNLFFNYGTGTPIFVTVATGQQSTIITDNKLFGAAVTFLSDSGVGTVSTNLGNFRNSAQQ